MAPSITQADELSKYVVEDVKTDLPLGETYIGLTLKKGGILLSQEELAPSLESKSLGTLVGGSEGVDLHFVPYWARANRGGKQQMRVGIRTMD